MAGSGLVEPDPSFAEGWYVDDALAQGALKVACVTILDKLSEATAALTMGDTSFPELAIRTPLNNSAAVVLRRLRPSRTGGARGGVSVPARLVERMSQPWGMAPFRMVGRPALGRGRPPARRLRSTAGGEVRHDGVVPQDMPPSAQEPRTTRRSPTSALGAWTVRPAASTVLRRTTGRCRCVRRPPAGTPVPSHAG